MKKSCRLFSWILCLAFACSVMSGVVLAAEPIRVSTPPGLNPNQAALDALSEYVSEAEPGFVRGSHELDPSHWVMIDGSQLRTADQSIVLRPDSGAFIDLGQCSSVWYDFSYSPVNVTVSHGINEFKSSSYPLVGKTSSNGSGEASYNGSYGQKYIYVYNKSLTTTIVVSILYGGSF